MRSGHVPETSVTTVSIAAATAGGGAVSQASGQRRTRRARVRSRSASESRTPTRPASLQAMPQAPMAVSKNANCVLMARPAEKMPAEPAYPRGNQPRRRPQPDSRNPIPATRFCGSPDQRGEKSSAFTRSPSGGLPFAAQRGVAHGQARQVGEAGPVRVMKRRIEVVS